jgi:hypothetical protein
VPGTGIVRFPSLPTGVGNALFEAVFDAFAAIDDAAAAIPDICDAIAGQVGQETAEQLFFGNVQPEGMGPAGMGVTSLG